MKRVLGSASTLFCIALLALAFQVAATYADAAPLAIKPQVVRGHVPAAAKALQPLERLQVTNRLNLAIGLPLRDTAGLSRLLQEIYDPASPKYHHYLTPGQFTEAFGPSKEDYEAVGAFMEANGLEVTTRHPNRLLLDVRGSVADLERVLHVTMRVYQHPTEKRTFYAPDREPALELATPILHIGGLDNYALAQPRLQAKAITRDDVQLPNSGAGPNGTYMGGDFRAAYVPDTTLSGAGQKVGLLQFDGYTPSDIAYYEDINGLSSVTLSNVLIDGASGQPSGSGGEIEVSLDIEMCMSMAPGLSEILVYEAPNPSPFEDVLNRMATDNLAKQLSCSWYMPGAPADPNADQIWRQMAAQGQSFYNASGDADAYTGLIDFPGDSPYITQVGGTTLTTSGPGGSWVSETVWNWGMGIGSGGGISTQYPIPSWQTNVSMGANQGSTTMRNTPDVALTADHVYVRADGGDWAVGGTSCAAPLWAGFTALVNQQAVATSQAPLGFLNPLVYSIGLSANYSFTFHDITTGNNTSSWSPTKYYAVHGYDLCTGWGTPAGQKLINSLANPEPLIISPLSGFTSSGGAGGPFTLASQSLILTNGGTNALNWSLVNTSAWLNASPSGGSLAPGGGSTAVEVSLNSAASNLVVGDYGATIWFTNLNDSVGQGRSFSLAVIPPPTIITQPTNQAPLEGAGASFMVSATGGLPLYYQWRENGTNLSDAGNISGSLTTNLTISDVNASWVGIYAVVVSNTAGVVVSSNTTLSITPSAPVIVAQPESQTIWAGRAAQFSVSLLGNTPMYFQWQDNGTNLADGGNIIGSSTSTLTLTNAAVSQSGAYSLVISNAIGAVTSSNAMLTVNPPPPCDAPPAGLVSWWRGEGNAFDQTGGNDGTLAGAATYGPGEVGQGFAFRPL